MFMNYIHIKFQITRCNDSSVTAIKTKDKHISRFHHTTTKVAVLQNSLHFFFTWSGSSSTPEQIGHTSSSSTSPWNRFTSKPILCRPEMNAFNRVDYLLETKFIGFQLCFKFLHVEKVMYSQFFTYSHNVKA